MNATEKLRIAIIRQRYTPFGGAERFVERALKALVDRGAEVTLIARRWEGAPQTGFRTKICDPRYSRLFGGRVARDKSFSESVRREIACGNYDIVQSHERIPGCMIFRAGDGVHAAWLAHRQRGQARFSRWFSRVSPFHRFILRQEAAMLSSPSLRAVICNSVLVRDEMRQYYAVPDDKLEIIENGVDLEKFHPRVAEEWRVEQRKRLGIAPDTPVFLFVGSGFERKGVSPLLCAIRRMKNRQAAFLVVGQDRKAGAYLRQAESLGVSSRVRFLGPQVDVLPYYGAADAFVLPTCYDPMPNAALEAMACGLPMITSTTCGMASRVVAGKNGYCCDAFDIEALSGHLDSLAEPGAAKSMRQAARDAVMDLDLGRMAERLVGLYRRLR